jgi:ABC-type phosphate transport system substrate-binding protein
MSALTQKMGRVRNRAGLLVGASAAVLAFAGVSASSAGAVTTAPTCPGTVHIKGMGSSLQKTAQEIWTGREVKTVVAPSEIPAEGTANAKANSYRAKCASKSPPPTVTYGSSGSGKGLAAFGYTGGSLNNELAFVGTDDGPTTEEIGKAETAGGTQAVILPVSQTAIAVMVHLPTGCTLTGGIAWQDLNKVFGGKNIKRWTEFSTASSKVVGGPCDHEITRVVPAEASGTTLQFKNYLQTLMEQGGAEKLPCKTAGTEEWKGLEGIGTGEKPNTAWPTCAGSTSPILAAVGGDAAVATAVDRDPNTIGFAALPDAEAHLKEGATLVKLQNGENLGMKSFAEPGTTSGTARCLNSRYTVPVAGRPGASGSGLSVDWSTTFGAVPKINGSEYPLCTLTYLAAWNTYTEAKYGSGHAAIQGLVNDYVTRYVISTASTQGQEAIKGSWYSAMPKNVQESAEFIALNLE